MLGTLLSWMNDHTSNVYVVATCNDISKLPPELTRAERFDGIVFLDLPGRKQKDQIWQQYLKLFQLDVDQMLPQDDQFTGAEIRSCCRLAALLDVPLVQAISMSSPSRSRQANPSTHFETGPVVDVSIVKPAAFISLSPKSLVLAERSTSILPTTKRLT